MASLHLNPDLKARLERVSKITGKTKSQVIREAVAEYCDKALQQVTLDVALADYIGALSSKGKSDSSKVKEVFGQILEEKYRTGHL